MTKSWIKCSLMVFAAGLLVIGVSAGSYAGGGGYNKFKYEVCDGTQKIGGTSEQCTNANKKASEYDGECYLDNYAHGYKKTGFCYYCTCYWLPPREKGDLSNFLD